MTRLLPVSNWTSSSGQLVIAGRTADQADVGRPLEDLLAFLLGDAAQDAEGLSGVLPLELVEPVENLLFGFVADAAGVVEQQIGFGWAFPPASSRATAACR